MPARELLLWLSLVRIRHRSVRIEDSHHLVDTLHLVDALHLEDTLRLEVAFRLEDILSRNA